MMIKAILFDKDGTIADFPATFNPATRQVLEKLCDGEADKLAAVANAVKFDLHTDTIADDSVIVAGSGHDIATLIAPYLEISDTHDFAVKLDSLYGEICVKTVKALPDVIEGLQSLGAMGFALGVATNDAQKNAASQMQSLGISNLFSQILGADSGFGPKPGPGMIKAFIDEMALAPEEVLMVGDSLHDLEAGRKAGARTCGVETGPASRQDLEAHADIVLPSVAVLPNWLKQTVSV